MRIRGARGTAPRLRAGSALSMLLLSLTIFGPISMDMYLPVLPALTEELGATTSAAQLTVTACLLGLAAGQVVAGPLTDRLGRRTPLLVGILAYIAASALCAASPTIETLIPARFVQGMAGAVGIVIAQASGRDLYQGGALIRYYGRITVLGGLAAIIGPLIGGQLARVTDWRGIFVVLAGIGALLLVGALAVHRETLPPERRTSGGVRHTFRAYRTLLSDRLFLGATLVTGFMNAALFAYLAGGTYVLQGIYGVSPQGYSLVFGLTSLGFVVFGYLAARSAERWSEHGTLAVGVLMGGAGALGLLATALERLPLPAIVVSLVVIVGGIAVTAPPSTSLALADHPRLAGTASSLLGLTRFALGGLAAPLVGFGGAHTTLPLGIVTVAASTLAGVAYFAIVGRDPGASDIAPAAH